MSKIFKKIDLNLVLYIVIILTVGGTAVRYILGDVTSTEWYLSLCFVELILINMNFYTLFDRLADKDKPNE